MAYAIARGLSDKEVADMLCRSYHTIRTQRKSIYAKLRISKDTELVLWVMCDALQLHIDLREIRSKGIQIIADAIAIDHPRE